MYNPISFFSNIYEISNIVYNINILNDVMIINIRYLNAYKKSKVNLFNNISNNDSGIKQFQAHPPNSHVSSMARILNDNDKYIQIIFISNSAVPDIILPGGMGGYSREYYPCS